MDLAIHFWDENKNVSSTFWNSSFMGHLSVSDLLRGFKEGLGEEVEEGKAVQVSMDGPNPTCSAQRFPVSIEEHRRGNRQVPEVYLQCFHIFSCSILPHLKMYFKCKSAQLPDTYSVKKTAEILEDCLLFPKLHFFLTIASSFKSLLREFQTPKPMFPFLHSAVENLTRELMERFIKPILESAHTTYKLINIDVENVDSCVKLRQVKIGPAARQSLNEARVKEVYMEKGKNYLVKIVRKFIKRNPLKYKFVQASTCLDPKKILTKPEQCKTGFETCVGMLLVNHHVTAILADQAFFQFDAWQVVKIILVFSHGNAFVEVGFSIDKEVLVENCHEESLVALRRVWNGIQDCHSHGSRNA
ncbi:hypothetical protein PR048_009708 [Dryococelus australis]|uniref:Uncharacterized protein n=1 Tax=Dryococelus australis TaxID=614101 RepID=A0ABQ9I1P4_9NEOP|nr:hypothetical protein PR048_009708 [Dryococelus australis]